MAGSVLVVSVRRSRSFGASPPLVATRARIADVTKEPVEEVPAPGLLHARCYEAQDFGIGPEQAEAMAFLANAFGAAIFLIFVAVAAWICAASVMPLRVMS